MFLTDYFYVFYFNKLEISYFNFIFEKHVLLFTQEKNATPPVMKSYSKRYLGG